MRPAAAGPRWNSTRANAITRAQLPPDLDTARAASVVQAFLGGVLRDWLLNRGSITLPRDARYLADGYIGMLRHSQSLRQSALQVWGV